MDLAINLMYCVYTNDSMQATHVFLSEKMWASS